MTTTAPIPTASIPTTTAPTDSTSTPSTPVTPTASPPPTPDATAPAALPRASARRARPWLRTAPAVFALAWGGNHFTPLLNMYERLGDYATWQANLLLGVYVAGLIPGLLVASAVSDRLGRKPVLVVGSLLAIGGSALLAGGLHDYALLLAGRVLAGIGVGIAMSVGTSWVKELSSRPHDDTDAGAGARRPALTLTLGFGIGAGAAGALAQWGPAPSVTPYLLQIALTVIALVPLLFARETRRSSRAARPEREARSPERPARSHAATQAPGAPRAYARKTRLPSARRRAFLLLVVPSAPWVFGSCSIAYAILPAVTEPAFGEWTTLFATALTVLTLGIGVATQPLVRVIDRALRGRALSLGMLVMTLGIGLAVVAAATASPVWVVAAAVAIGIAYGITVVSALAIVQRIADPDELAGLTGIFYALAYAGFALPAVLAALLPVIDYAGSLAIVAAVCLVCLVTVVVNMRRIPAAER